MCADAPSKPVLLLARPALSENPDELVADLETLAREHGLPGPYRIARGFVTTKHVSANSAIVFDSPLRIAKSMGEVIAWMAAAMEKGCDLHGPPPLSILGNYSQSESCKLLLYLGGTLPREFRSRSIREGLHLARQRQVRLGRTPIASNVVQEALAEYECRKSFRATEKALRERGIYIGRTAIAALVRAEGTTL